jgi:hypothetical protein
MAHIGSPGPDSRSGAIGDGTSLSAPGRFFRVGSAVAATSARTTSSSSAREGYSAFRVASYSVNQRAVEHAQRLIRGRQYVLRSEWGEVQPRAAEENTFLESHSWDEYGDWHLGLTEGAPEETKARYAFVYGDFRRLHRSGIIACHYRAAEWRHKEIELAAHELLQLLDARSA